MNTQSQPVPMPCIAFYEVFPEEEQALRAALAAVELTGVYHPETIQASGHELPAAPLVSIRTQSRLPASWRPLVRALVTRSTGYDHLLPLAALPDAPALAALPEYCTRAVAEQALLLWLALLRRLPAQLHQGKRFNRDHLTGHECAGRTLTVVGVGRIGHEIARVGQALDLRIIGVDLVARHPDVTYLPPGPALAEADIVVCAMNLTPDNHAYFDAARWAQVRPGAVFVNVARGELSPPAPLLQALRDGRLGGAALDVYDSEDELADALRRAGPAGAPPVWRELMVHPAVLCTPHNAFNTSESVARKSEFTARQCRAFLSTGRFEWPLVIPTRL